MEAKNPLSALKAIDRPKKFVEAAFSASIDRNRARTPIPSTGEERSRGKFKKFSRSENVIKKKKKEGLQLLEEEEVAESFKGEERERESS